MLQNPAKAGSVCRNANGGSSSSHSAVVLVQLALRLEHVAGDVHGHPLHVRPVALGVAVVEAGARFALGHGAGQTGLGLGRGVHLVDAQGPGDARLVLVEQL